MRKKNKHKYNERQIVTFKKDIKWLVACYGFQGFCALLRALCSDIDTVVYKNYLIVAAGYFERLSCLVYRGMDGKIRKLEPDTYRKLLFEDWGETVAEIADRIGRQVGAEQIFKLVWQSADLVVPMVSCIEEQGFLHEYAYAIDYVVHHEGTLLKPIMQSLFPINYQDYNYNKGIAEEIGKYTLD